MAQRQHVADHAYFERLGTGDYRRGKDCAGRVDVEIGEVVLVDQDAVEPKALAHGPLLKVFLVRLGGKRWVAETIGLPGFRANLIRNARIGRLIKAIELQSVPPGGS